MVKVRFKRHPAQCVEKHQDDVAIPTHHTQRGAAVPSQANLDQSRHFDKGGSVRLWDY